MKYNFERVCPIYTGGGIYVFYGKVNGHWFSADDANCYVYLFDETPFEEDGHIKDEAQYIEFYEEHSADNSMIADEFDFMRQMLKWVIKHEEYIRVNEMHNYDPSDMERSLEYIEQMESEIKNTFYITCHGKTKSFDESERQKMIDFYMNGILSCDGAEKERYMNIYIGLVKGQTYVTDEL